nr:hypothetical protein [Tanacetum cinerariifolium]
DENPIRTLRDYFKPSYEGYKNTIELPVGNNMSIFSLCYLFLNPFSSTTIGDENPIRTLRDYFKPSYEGYKNTIPVGNNMCEIDHVAGGKLHNNNADESWEIIENLALYDHEGWKDTNVFAKPVKAISTSQGISKTPDRRLLEHEDQLNFSLKGPDMEVSVKESETKNRAKSEAKNKPIKNPKKEEVVEAPSSRPVEYYLKHRINEKPIEGLVDNRIVEDVSAEIAEHVYPIDFVILDIKEDKKRHFILGIRFLTTAKAVIKFDKGTIPLRSGKSKISFYRILESPGTIERGVNNKIKPTTPTMTMNRLVLEWEESIRLHQGIEFDR